VHAFRLPMHLGRFDAYPVLQQDSLVHDLALGPAQFAYWTSPIGASAGSAAFALLAAAALLACLVGGTPRRWREHVPVLALLLLSLVQMRAIPFFVIAAVPVIARAGAHVTSRILARDDSSERPLRRALVRSARLLTFCAGLALLALAWPGWLQPLPGEARSLELSHPRTLEQAAQAVSSWRQQGLLAPGARGLNLSPDVGNVFAWATPGERNFFDSRLTQLGPDATADLVNLRRRLDPLATAADRAEVRRVLRRWRIAHLTVQYGATSAPWLVHCFQQPEEWPILFQEGPTIIFGWRDPEGAPRIAAPTLDLRARALHPPETERAPVRAPAKLPVSGVWWWDAYSRRPGNDDEREAAALHRLHFDALRPAQARLLRQVLHAQAVCKLALLGAAPFDPFALGSQVACNEASLLIRADGAPSKEPLAGRRLAAHLGDVARVQLDAAPPEHLWLALRAARRGVRADPRDAACFVELGEAYGRLVVATRENVLTSPRFRRFRRMQAIAAYQQALVLQPSLGDAHAALADLCREEGLLELAHHHLQELARLARSGGARRGETAEQHQDRLDRLDDVAGHFEAQVAKVRRYWTTHTAELPLLDRADAAFKLGLPLESLKLLLGNDVAAFGAKGLYLEMELLLLTGRVHDARAWLEPAHRDLLGPHDYHWLKAEVGAIAGNYEEALEHLGELAGLTVRVPELAEEVSPRTALALNIGRTLLGATALVPQAFAPDRADLSRQRQGLLASLEDEADITAFAGLLALEAGLPQARDLLRRAVGPRPDGSTRGLSFPLRRYAERWLRELEGGR
jgi:tetratricopeptide (TPR) repeat protein